MKTDYDAIISPPFWKCDHVILTPLPLPSTHLDLFYRYKHKTESLGIANIKKSETYFYTDPSDWIRDAKLFFNRGINYSFDSIPNHKVFQTFSENFIKPSVYSLQYLNAGCKFNDPMCFHWDPEEKIFNIHPGGTRQKIWRAFGPEEISALVFNTAGHRVKFKKRLDHKEEFENYFSRKEIHFTVVADHGTLIPHVHFNQRKLYSSWTVMHEQVRSFWLEHGITTNFNLLKLDEDWEPVLNNRKKHLVHIYAQTEMAFIKALWLSSQLNRKTHETHEFRITFT